MAALTLRSVKGSRLTNAEVDANFTALNNDIATRAQTNQNATFANLTATGNTVLGDASTDTLTINGNSASIPNGLNFSGGSVGIGTTPSHRLDVLSASATVARFKGTSTVAGLQLENDVGAVWNALAYSSTYSGGTVFGVGANGLSLAQLADAPIAIGTYAVAQPLLFATNSVVRGRFDGSGNFGVGIAPLTRMHVAVAGTGRGAGDVVSETIGANGNAGYALRTAGVDRWSITTSGTDGSNSLRIRDENAAATRAVFDASGNLAIGPAAPVGSNRVLEIGATTRALTYLRAQSQTAGAALFEALASGGDTAIFGVNNSGGALHGIATGSAGISTGAYPLSIVVASSERVQIGTSGNMGVGVAADSTARLRVDASNPTRGIVAHIRNGASATQTGAQLIVTQNGIADWAIGQPAGVSAFAIWRGRNSAADGTEVARFDSSNNFGIGTTTPGARLHAEASADGTVAYFTSTSTTRSGRISLDANGTWFGNNATLAGEGAYFQASINALRLYTNGVERARIDANGNLGLGAASAGPRLDVYGNGNVLGIRAGSNDHAYLSIYPRTADTSVRGAYIGFAASAATNLTIQNELAGGIVFATNNVTRATLDSSGNLTPQLNSTYNLGSGALHWATLYATAVQRDTAGVLTINSANAAGTIALRTAGADALLVSSSGSITLPRGSLSLDPGGTTSVGIELGSTGGASTPYIDLHCGATATDYDVRLIASGGTGSAGGATLSVHAGSVVVANAAQVGGSLGVRGAPSITGLSVGGSSVTGENYLRVNTSTNDLYLGQSAGTIFGYNTGTAGYLIQNAGIPLGIGTLAAQPLVFGTNNTKRGEITSGGSLLMQGFAGSCAATTGQNVEIRNNGGTGDANMALLTFHCSTQYATHLGLRADGYIGLGGWSASTWRWYVYMPSGDMTSVGNVTAYSDERLKKDWAELPSDFVERLAAVKHGTYTRIDTEARQVGVSAQSLQPVLPEAVTLANDGDTLQVAYGNAALAAVVAMAKRLVELEHRVRELEAA